MSKTWPGNYLRTLCVERAGRVYVDTDSLAPGQNLAQIRQCVTDLKAHKEPFWPMCDVLLDFYKIQEGASLSPEHPVSSIRDLYKTSFISYGVLLDSANYDSCAPVWPSKMCGEGSPGTRSKGGATGRADGRGSALGEEISV